jgi:predicted Fe-S protein YdhL (DUF1289 family)
MRLCGGCGQDGRDEMLRYTDSSPEERRHVIQAIAE